MMNKCIENDFVTNDFVKNVLCEKPMALNTEDAELMRATNDCEFRKY